MSDLDRLNDLRTKAKELASKGLVNDYSLRNLDVLIGNELILVRAPKTKYERRIEILAKANFTSEKTIERILQKRKEILSEG